MTAQRRARRRRRRGPRPAARHSQSGTAPGPRWPISGRRAAANRGARGAGAQLGAAGHGSVGRRRVPPGSSPPPARASSRRHGRSGRGTAHLALGLPAGAMGIGRVPPDPETGVSLARTVKRLLCGRSASEGRRAGAREPALGGHFEQCSLAGAHSAWASFSSPTACRGYEDRAYTYCVPAGVERPGRRSLSPRTSCSPEEEDTKLMRMTLSVTVRFGERLTSVRRRARS